jgi:hypothetical protein
MEPVRQAFKPGGVEKQPVEAAVLGADDRPGKRRALCCAACGHGVTDEGHRVSVHGQSEYRFMNPGGFVFDLVCFGRAPGCRERGSPTAEFTWFPGYTWRYAVCGGCDLHLGWLFEGGSWSQFYGLIANRLRPAEEGEGEHGEGGRPG